jgi:hypothetical protein
LYRPRRIGHGAVLYRDVDSFYGPLSQYINAQILAPFGPGLMHLVWANLAVLAAIVVTLYCLLRRAWGGFAAVLASAIFVTVFCFSQSNYTYLAPYSQETTHGLLVLLLLLDVLERWVANPSRPWSALPVFSWGSPPCSRPNLCSPHSCSRWRLLLCGGGFFVE